MDRSPRPGLRQLLGGVAVASAVAALSVCASAAIVLAVSALVAVLILAAVVLVAVLGSAPKRRAALRVLQLMLHGPLQHEHAPPTFPEGWAQARTWHEHARKIGVGEPQRQRDGSAQGPAWLVSGEGFNCTIACVDVAGFGDHQRDDDVQLHIRRSLYGILEEAFRVSPIAWHGCYREDRGDGVLIVALPGVPAGALVHSFVEHLSAGLRRHNKMASSAAQIRLRMAVHIGQVHRDDNGVAGQAVVHAFRLLDAPTLKQEFAASSALLAVVVSDYLYENVIRHGHGLIDPASYRRLDVVVRTRTTAWLHVHGSVHREPPSSAHPWSGTGSGSLERPTQNVLPRWP